MMILSSLFVLLIAPGCLAKPDTSHTVNTFQSIKPSSTLRWVPCYESSDAAKYGPISCARLIAPLDYDDERKGQVQLALIRLGAFGKPDTRRTVLMNPGGPGDDPIEFVQTRAPQLRAYIGSHIDLVAVVPRGVTSTTPIIACNTVDQANTLDVEILDAQPGYKSSGLNNTYSLGERIGKECRTTSPQLIPYLGTVFVAKDFMFVSKKLGQDKISYLGYSYGSVLGETIAALFPQKIDRMVLDGILDFNDYWQPIKNPEWDTGDADKALEYFFQSCFDAGRKLCPLWSSQVSGIRNKLGAALESVTKKPLPIPGSGTLTAPLFRTGIWSAMYRPQDSFVLLAGVTSEILARKPGPYIKAYIENFVNPPKASEPPLKDPKTGLINTDTAAYAIACSDSGSLKSPPSAVKLQKLYDDYVNTGKTFAGPASQYEIICLGANIPAKERYTKKISKIRTSHSILFVGNTADPTTPIRNAFRMSEVFTGSRVLSIKGAGHISFRANPGLDCGRKWIEPYFREGILPPAGTVCDGGQDPFGMKQS